MMLGPPRALDFAIANFAAFRKVLAIPITELFLFCKPEDED
jgi:hypothetical protein